MRKYAVIYRSVVMENLQYAANIALGFVSYLSLSLCLSISGGISIRSPEQGLPDIPGSR